MPSRRDAISRGPRPVNTAAQPVSSARTHSLPAGFADAYRLALVGYLQGSGESGLTEAWELGRRALRERLGLLEVTAFHFQLVAGQIPRRAHTVVPRLQEAAGLFLLEVLASFEMAQRGFDEATQVLRQLNQRLENELRRIAHSLHDEVQQLLVTVYIGLEEIRDELPAEKAAPLSAILRQVDGIAEHVRAISHELRPTILDDLGLLRACEFLAEGVSKRAGIRVEVRGSTGGRLPTDVETALYRLMQEALTNATKHGKATHISVTLERQPRSLTGSVRDDGVGFDVPAVLSRADTHGLGLIGMRERLVALGGRFSISSKPNHGTQIQFDVPLED